MGVSHKSFENSIIFMIMRTYTIKRIIFEEISRHTGNQKLTLYHGTKSNFNQFDLRFFNQGSFDGGWLGYGVYLTNDYNYAESYGDVLECEVHLRKPYVITEYGYSTEPERLRNELGVRTAREITDTLKQQGYDSVMLTYEDDSAYSEDGFFIEVCVFDPSSIKIINRYSKDDDSKEVMAKRGYKV